MPLFSTNLDARMTQGNTPVLKFAIYDDQGSPFNTTASGLSALWVLKKSVNDSAAIVSKTNNSGIAFVAPNFVNVSMAVVDTNTISGCYVHELKLTDNAGNVLTVKKIEDSAVGDTPAINVFQIDRAVAAS